MPGATLGLQVEPWKLQASQFLSARIRHHAGTAHAWIKAGEGKYGPPPPELPSEGACQAKEQANTRNAFHILWSRQTPGAWLAANIAEDHCPAIIHVRISGLERGCPLYPQKRTLELAREMSALCQKLTSIRKMPYLENQELARSPSASAIHAAP